MRSLSYSLPVLAVIVGLSPAQQPNNPGQANVDIVLSNWEKAMLNVQSLTAEVKRTKLDKTYQTTELYEGTASYLRGAPGQTSRASLELFKKNQPQVFEKYLCTGNFLYQWSPAEKVIRRHELPQPKPGQLADDKSLSFLVGMKAEDAQARYQITYGPAPANDKWYQYLRIQPKLDADKADFIEARLVLLSSNYLPRQLWFLQPTKDEVTWDFPRVTSPANLTPANFATPQVPPGWKFDTVSQKSPPPRVLRNNGQ